MAESNGLRHGTPPDQVASGVRPTTQTLGWRSLVQLLIDALDHRFDGTLQLVDDRGRRHELVLERGVPCQVNTPLSIEPFDKTLQRLGLGGEFIQQSALEGALRIRMMALVERLFSLSDETRFHFFANLDLATEGTRTPCNAMALIMRGLRRQSHSSEANRLLDDLGRRPLALRPNVTTRMLGLTPIECNIVGALERRPATLELLCARRLGPAPLIRAAVYALATLRFLEGIGDDPPLSLPDDLSWLVPPRRVRRGRDHVDIDDVSLFERAQVLFRHRNLDDAEELLETLLLTRDHPAAKALLAWLRAERLGRGPQLRPGTITDRYDKSLTMLDEVIVVAPLLERARYWRGQLRKRSGRHADAMDDFRAVVRINPRNVGAARALSELEALRVSKDQRGWKRHIKTGDTTKR